MVHVGWRSSTESGTVGGSSEVLPGALVVLVSHFDIDFDFSVDLVLDIILSIIGIDNLNWNMAGVPLWKKKRLEEETLF